MKISNVENVSFGNTYVSVIFKNNVISADNLNKLIKILNNEYIIKDIAFNVLNGKLYVDFDVEKKNGM